MGVGVGTDMKVLIALPLLAVVFAGCVQDPGFATPPMDEEGRYVIQMTAGSTFVPSHFEVPANATIVFSNTGGVWHDVHSDDNLFSSPRVDGGKTWEMQAPSEPGDYGFYCAPHRANGMTGVMRVV